MLTGSALSGNKLVTNMKKMADDRQQLQWFLSDLHCLDRSFAVYYVIMIHAIEYFHYIDIPSFEHTR